MRDLVSFRIRKDEVVEIIKGTSYLGIFIAILTLVATFFVTPLLFGPLDITAQIINTFGAVIILLLSIGIYFKNRFCAIALLIIYVIDTLSLFIMPFISNFSVEKYSVVISGIAVHIFFLFYFIKGTKAVFVYRKYIKIQK
ncbi:hypothetical protein HYU07_06080 [Candidatus Woesearchaeota archaeon]|nr:hypothetical protein [Candidatus Woesearchaeota archaeon]